MFAGLWNGHLHVGHLRLSEVDEFVASCKAAGWTSVAVVNGTTIVARWRK